MRRLVLTTLCIAACARPGTGTPSAAPGAAAARGPSRVQVDTFVRAMRDMAAWAIVTPAAHIPVGGLQGAAGTIASVTNNVGAMPVPTPDTAVATMRDLLSAAARQQRATLVGLGYLVRRAPPGASAPVNAVLVEVESAAGYRADVLWPYTRNEFGEPQFTRSFVLPGTMRVYSPALPSR